jgi:hypothetical protein
MTEKNLVGLWIGDLRQTCFAVPSQWEGRLRQRPDGQAPDLYIRYRYGELRVEVDHEVVYREQIGDDLDGVMDIDTVLQHTGLAVEPELLERLRTAEQAFWDAEQEWDAWEP